MFTAHFVTSKKCPKSQESLLNVVERKNEPIQSYIKHFNEECLQIPDLDPVVRLTAARKGIKHKEFMWYIGVHCPRTIEEFLDLAERFMSTEEALGPKAEIQQGEKRKRQDEGASSNKYRRKKSKSPKRSKSPCQRSKSPSRGSTSGRQSRTPPVKRTSYTPLNAKRGEILMAIKDYLFVKWPPRIWGDPVTKNLNVYYDFHCDIGHNIENCQNLRDEIEELIHHEYLKKYIKHENRESSN
ncbi:PREDICTED: uncharacterized protein LOC104611269 [Nelumbo nucifera]|uniref:Uncharacterized protein LOC104611269 n=1 Tax=Nelumbo nucifera TaxID=4432 RepID=A0A1U8BHU2_NELNU|nr:PREDICTED: uncharacterized protein LOC104611269 [Nelumbo nucifera]